MGDKSRKTAIDIIGDVPWGTHFCQFYQTKEDLIDILVPYFEAGLEDNEFCMWITSEPLNSEDAKQSLKKKVKNLDDYITKGQIEILDYTQWYTNTGSFDADEVLQGWIEKEKQALEKGFEGLRLSGNTFWLDQNNWKRFTDYEDAVNSVIGQHRMLAICTYSLEKCTPLEIIDVVSNHEFALIRRAGKWEIIESAEHKKMAEARRQSEEEFRLAFENAVDAIFWADPETGLITNCNKAAETLLERRREDIIGQHQATVHPPEKSEYYLHLFKKHAEQKEVSNNYAEVITKSGKIKPVNITASLTMVGGKPLMQGIFHNITKLEQIEEALRESQRQLSVRNSIVEIFLTTPDDEMYGEVLEVLLEAMESKYGIFGYIDEHERLIIPSMTRDIWEKCQVPDKTIVYPREKWGGIWGRALKEKKSLYANEGLHVPEGHIPITNVLVVPVMYGGQVIGLLEVANRPTEYNHKDQEFLESIAGKIAPILNARLQRDREEKERKQAEEALKRSEERYTLAQQAANIGSWDWDIDTGDLIWSEQIEPMFGFGRGEFGATYEAFLECVHPDDRQHVSNSVNACVEDGKDYAIEHRIVWPDGTVRWVSETGDVIRDEGGKAIRMLGIVRDITDHKLAIEQIENLAKFPSEDPSPVLRMAKNGVVLYANSASDSLLAEWGCQVGQTAIKNWCRIVSDVFASGSARRIEVEHAGRIFAFMLVPVVEADYVNLYGRDITDTKKAQEVLWASEEQFRRAVLDSPLPIMIHAEDGEVLQISKVWTDLTGYTPEEIPTLSAWTERAYGDRKDIVKSRIDKIFDYDTRVEEGEYVICSKDGETLIWDFSSAPLGKLPDGRRLVISMAMDITERKQIAARQELTGRILECLNQKNRSSDLIHDVIKLIKDSTGFEAVGVRLHEGEDFPYFGVKGFPKDFVEDENYLCARNEEGEQVFDEKGHPVLSCMCGSVIIGQVNRDLPFFTEGGSFWTNSTTELQSSGLLDTLQVPLRNRCNEAGYESVALIPLRSGYEIVGLLQLNDSRPERFTLEKVRFFERIGASIGIALARIKAEENIHNLAKFPSEDPNPVLRIAKEGTVLYANAAGSELLTTWGCNVGERAPGHWHQYILRMLKSGSSEELEVPCGDRVFSLVMAPVTDAGYVNTYGIDITERKHAEEDLMRYRQHLEELVETRTAELTQTNKQLLREIEVRKRLEKEILDISEQERRKIGQELHDSLGQQLTGVAFMTKVMEQKLSKKSPSEAADLKKIAKLVNQATEQARGLSKGLHPVDLDKGTLMSALQELAASTETLFGIHCTLRCDKRVQVNNQEVAVHLYRITQEAITNAIKHGRAKNIQIDLTYDRNQSVLTVRSDGIDFPKELETKRTGMGLQLMDHRVDIIGGSLDIRKGPDGGTIVTCTFPIKKQ